MDFNGWSCVSTCDPFYWLSSDGSRCVDYCNFGEYISSTGQCVPICDVGMPTVGYPLLEYIGVCRCQNT